MSKKGLSIFIKLLIALAVASLLLVTFLALDSGLASGQYEDEGIYLSEVVNNIDEAKFNRTRVERYLKFKLKDNSAVTINASTFSKQEHNKGDRAKLFYKKGKFTGRSIYVG